MVSPFGGSLGSPWQQNTHVGIIKAPWAGLRLICDHSGPVLLVTELPFLSSDYLLPKTVHLVRSGHPQELEGLWVAHLWAESKPEQLLTLQTGLSQVGVLSLAALVCQRQVIAKALR